MLKQVYDDQVRRVTGTESTPDDSINANVTRASPAINITATEASPPINVAAAVATPTDSINITATEASPPINATTATAGEVPPPPAESINVSFTSYTAAPNTTVISTPVDTEPTVPVDATTAANVSTAEEATIVTSTEAEPVGAPAIDNSSSTVVIATTPTDAIIEPRPIIIEKDNITSPMTTAEETTTVTVSSPVAFNSTVEETTPVVVSSPVVNSTAEKTTPVIVSSPVVNSTAEETTPVIVSSSDVNSTASIIDTVVTAAIEQPAALLNTPATLQESLSNITTEEIVAIAPPASNDTTADESIVVDVDLSDGSTNNMTALEAAKADLDSYQHKLDDAKVFAKNHEHNYHDANHTLTEFETNLASEANANNKERDLLEDELQAVIAKIAIDPTLYIPELNAIEGKINLFDQERNAEDTALQGLRYVLYMKKADYEATEEKVKQLAEQVALLQLEYDSLLAAKQGVSAGPNPVELASRRLSSDGLGH